MYAITLDGFGGPEVMAWTEVPDPAPGPDEVLLDVVAAGVNRADLLQRRGLYPPPPGASPILGLECAGTIRAIGAGVTGRQIGDRVCALLAGGGYAEQVAVPADQLLPVPVGLDLVAAAALPEVACTVWSNVVTDSRLTAGELLLVHGGGSGIGTHAIQVGVALGADVAVTAGSAEKLDRCRELGATVLVNYRTDDFVAAIRATGRAGADVILDNMGAAYLARNVAALAPDGRLAIIGLQGGSDGGLALNQLLVKRGTIRATSLRGRPATGPHSKAAVVTQVIERLWPLVAAGTVRPVISAELAITEAARAHELLDSGETVGKVVLRLR
ncbi:NAD(P)H-quinone oxidoreductase [Skermania piniformis]|uniref:NAD(P)H-quinone oxidoreductase n=1 Tax=Skermania pinensis TaxID=39122 RepID=A0ABX8SBX8_9ACTN|nr:NAD(P)H-quinone oxidoreductase [Skermania piniformis]QXQ14090.1 NAD(P)H-quinone oxidoreductase [Skermania piniformis]